MNSINALWLIGITNLLFGIDCLFWKLNFWFRKNAGIDPFAGHLAVWFLQYCILSALEAIMISLGVRKGDRHSAALAGGCWAVQMTIACWQWHLMSGV
jgi:hypothetical protein